MRQAHRIPPAPSNLRHYDENLRHRDIPCRLDPGYDQPGPIRRGELSWALVIQAVVVALGIFLFIVLVSIVAID
jgi:hypothetical protein